jgi:hypothetical protein
MRLGRLRINILGFMTAPMYFVRPFLDFKAFATLTAASSLFRPPF